MEFPGVLKSIWKFQGSSKRVEFSPNQKKNHVEFPWVLVSGLEIPKGCSTILWNFLGWNFGFSWISKDKMANLKIPEIFWKKYVSNTHLIFFWNSPKMLKYGQLELKKNPHILGDGSRWDINLKWPFILKKIMEKSTNSPKLPIITCCKRVQKNLLWPLFMAGVQLPQG